MKTKKAKLPQSIVVIGRKYWVKGNGYTVSSAQIFVDGVEIEGVQGCSHGYDFAYQAFRKLAELGIIPDYRINQSPFSYCEEKGIKLGEVSVDVGRRSDLKF